MNDRDSIILYDKDDRTDLEKLHSVVWKLHQKYDKEELEFYCKVCKRDLLIAEESPTGISRGRTFVHKLLQHYRKTKLLSLGDQKAYDQILEDIGYPRNLAEIPPEISLEECCMLYLHSDEGYKDLTGFENNDEVVFKSPPKSTRSPVIEPREEINKEETFEPNTGKTGKTGKSGELNPDRQPALKYDYPHPRYNNMGNLRFEEDNGTAVDNLHSGSNT